MRTKHTSESKIDWMITLVPLGIIIFLCVLFFLMPDQSNLVLGKIRFFFGDTLGSYYLIIGLGIFLLSLYVAGSKYGNIVLGKPDEKPQYSFLIWGAMMFTCGLTTIGEAYRWNCRKNYRFAGCVCIIGRNRHDLQRSDTTDGSSYCGALTYRDQSYNN